ncbi:hypothetical protein P691DRAFT_611824, partial [Macrolepiota fuliginosa MF-IS2]
LCSSCIVASHEDDPFHHIQKWTGTYFTRTSLHDLGFILHLGHDGCPCPLNHGELSHFVVVHTNGIHKQNIFYCLCHPTGQQHDKHLQLLENQLFTPTLTALQTVFTFNVIKDFHCLSLSSKINLYDYCDALRKGTDAAFPQKIPVHVAPLILSGQHHNIDSILTHRCPGSLAVRCPSCPEIGFNINPEFLNQVINGKTHLSTLYVSGDGNFRLMRKLKNNDPDDVALLDGNVYFVRDGDYMEYLKAVPAPVDVGKLHPINSTCAHLKAVRQQNTSKFNNAAVSGVVAIQCTRHGFYLPQGVVDLEKGE